MRSPSLGQRYLSALLATAVLFSSLPISQNASATGNIPHERQMPFPDDNIQANLAAENICNNAMARAEAAGLAPEKVALVISVFDEEREIPAFVEHIIMKCRGMGLSVRRVKIKNKWKGFVQTIGKRMPYELHSEDETSSHELDQMIDHFVNTAKSSAETQAAYDQLEKLPRSVFKKIFKNNLLQVKKFFGLYNGLTLKMYVDDETGFKRPWKSREIKNEDGEVIDLIGGAGLEFGIKGHLIATTFLFTVMALIKHFGQMPETMNPALYLEAFGAFDALEKTITLGSGILAAFWQSFHTFFGQANLKFLAEGKRYFPRLNKVEKVYQWTIPAQMLLSSLAKFTIPLVAYGIDGTYGRMKLILSNLLLGAFGKNPFQAAIAGLKKSRKGATVTQDNGPKSDKMIMFLDAIVQTGFTFLAFSHLLNFTQSIPGIAPVAAKFGVDSIAFIFWTLGISGITYEILKYYRGEVRAPLTRKTAWEAIGKGMAADLKKMTKWISGKRRKAEGCQVHLQVIPRDNLSNKSDPKERAKSIEHKTL